MGFKSQQRVYGIILPKAQKAVLVALAYSRNEKTGECFPGQDSLAAMTGMSVRSVSRALAKLVALDVVSRSAHFRNDGARTSDRYVIDFDWQPKRPEVNLTTGQNDHQSPCPSPPDNLTVTTGHGVRLYKEEPQEEPQGVPEVLTAIIDIQIASFDDFYNIWPRKMKRPDALKAWTAAIRRETPDRILAAATEYANHPRRPARQFVPYPATWLRADGWNDEMPTAPEPERRTLTRAEQNLALARQMRAAGQPHPKEIAS